MRGFEDVTLSYDGAEYVIPADRLLSVIADVEEILRGTSGRTSMEVLLQPGGPSYARLCMAFAKALQAGGASVTDQQIYLKMQQDFAEGSPEAASAVQASILSLLAIMSPPLAMALSGHGDASGEAQAAD